MQKETLESNNQKVITLLLGGHLTQSDFFGCKNHLLPELEKVRKKKLIPIVILEEYLQDGIQKLSEDEFKKNKCYMNSIVKQLERGVTVPKEYKFKGITYTWNTNIFTELLFSFLAQNKIKTTILDLKYPDYETWSENQIWLENQIGAINDPKFKKFMDSRDEYAVEQVTNVVKENPNSAIIIIRGPLHKGIEKMLSDRNFEVNTTVYSPIPPALSHRGAGARTLF